MCLGDRVKDSGAIRMVGMTLICLAIVSNRILDRVPGVAPGIADFLTGLFFGVAFPIMIWSLARGAKRR